MCELWHGRSAVQLRNVDPADLDVVKLCCIDSLVFLLTAKGNVYRGELRHEDSALCLSCDLLDARARDLGCTLQQVYWVTHEGRVSACTPDFLLTASSADLQGGEVRQITPQHFEVRRLSVGSRGIVYLDDVGQLWASGWQKELGIDQEHLDSEPQRVEAFSCRHVLDVSLGSDFGLVLLQPSEQCEERSTPSPVTRVQDKSSTAQHMQAVFANVDAAKVYIKRQLSWVSEDVVGFVKGDRHREDSSESFEELDVEDERHSEDSRTQVELLSPHKECSLTELLRPHREGSFTDLLSPHKSGDSSLTASLERVSLKVGDTLNDSSATLSSHGSESERALALARAGLSLLDTQVWSWGDARSGQLGLGDMVKREKPSLVTRLRHCGVRQLACGAHHALALLLDGRVFVWGERQSSAGTTCSLDTLPKRLELPDNLRAVSIAAHNELSYVLTGEGRVFMLSKHSCYPEGIVELARPKDAQHEGAHRVVCCAQMCASIASDTLRLSSSQYKRLVLEQQLLEDMLEVRRLLELKVQERSAEVESLLRCHRALIGVTALNVAALADTEHGPALLMKHHVELLAIYHQFLSALSDAIACGALHQALAFEAKSGKQTGVVAALCTPLDNICVYSQEAKVEGGETSEQARAWRKLKSEARTQLNCAEETRAFWDSLANRFTLRSQLQEKGVRRRLVRDSRVHALELVGASRFSGSHWFILMSDCLAHVCGSQVELHSLRTLWVDPVPDIDGLQAQDALLLTAPETSLTVKCGSPRERAEWLQAMQGAIKLALRKPNLPSPPTVRNVTHTFTKHVLYKTATYTGRWKQGLPEGPGRMEWSTGRVYTGSFHQGHIHGRGRQTFPDGSYYEGQWQNGFQNGYGVEKSARGDVYEGHFLNGQRHGHGVRKEGQFMSSAASMYVGEWVAGRRQGYGVSDEISTGEKYLGLWANDAKHGCGMVVTLDGIYYEGNFSNGNLTGRGVMVWEDGSCYEGEFGAAGVFAGRGKLLLTSGDMFEGALHGAWNEGVKVSGTFRKSTSSNPSDVQHPKPSLFGKLSVLAAEKWRSAFTECLAQLGGTGETRDSLRTVRAWECVAVALDHNTSNTRAALCLDTIPQYGRVTLDAASYQQIKAYLARAFEEKQHPLGLLLSQLTVAYTATYGGVRVHPVLLDPAVSELHSLCARLYSVVRLLFPALPDSGEEQVLGLETRLATTSMPDIERHQRQPRPRSLSAEQECMGDAMPLHDLRRDSAQEDSSSLAPLDRRRDSSISSDYDLDDREVASCANLLYPLLLPRVHSALFVLYALHNKTQDDEYWRKLLKWNKQLDVALMAFLGIDRKFWPDASEGSSRCGHMFSEAVDTLQQLKTTFSPLEKLLVIRSTFQHLTKAVQQRLACDYLWNMDDLFPVFQLVVIRAQILQLGSEIHFVEDFMEPHLLNGELGIMFTTLKACYYQILQERIN